MAAGYGITATVAFIVSLSVSINQGDASLAHNGPELLVLVAPAVGLAFFSTRMAAQLLTCTGILVSCGVLVHGTNGLIEAHFSFFVTLPLIALYADWRPYAYSVVYVASTHGVIGAIAPETMYNHETAINSPYLWGLIHAIFVLALSTVMLVHWNFSDRRRIELGRALVDLHNVQGRLVESQKLESIGSLAAGVAHEINTPIQFVGDNLEFIAEATADIDRFVRTWLDHSQTDASKTTLDEAAHALNELVAEADLEFALEEIPAAVAQSQEGINRVAEIVRAMKGFSHPANEIAPCDLNELVTTTVAVSRGEWKLIADVDVDLADDLPLVPVPPGSFNQALLNMIVNATHAIDDKRASSDDQPLGRIEITTGRADDEHVAVTVSDNGCGIPDDIRHRVFEQFFTTKEVGRGTGQGLAITQSLVDGLGGQIHVETAPGVGTIFTLLLPSVETRAPLGQTAAPTSV